VTASIGISVFPDDGADVQTLLKNADIAMYRAKERGKNAYEFWSGEMNVHSMERLALEGELRRALERDEFLLHFQPKVELASGRIVGVESLVRWQRRDGRLVSPAEFIPLAEETGVIDALAEWVLRRACGELRRWRAQGAAALRMAVNLSARQFARKDLCATVAEVLVETGLEGGALEIEITESMVMRDPERAARVLGELKALGVQVAIDDFGTGYSSLSYLKRFPIDYVKIDRAFIEGLPGDADDVVITKAVIAMAHSLGLRVTAEGVETREQLEFLRDQGCDEAQGYFLAMPEPADAIAGRILAGTLAAPARQH
jgi:EAL domain-containing protein (putative c-di-GMP-specific phosphodiesterase class I)